MLRDIIEINEDLCNGCGNCVPGCHEGALQIVDGKARLISDLMCDGLGACVGHCPTGAMKVVKREAEPYDEARVMEENIIPAGKGTIKAHLKHLLDHNEEDYFTQAVQVLKAKGLEIPDLASPQENSKPSLASGHGCPGSAARILKPSGQETTPRDSSSGVSRLEQWPVQLHLLNPRAPFLKNADLLVAADCTAFSIGNFHDKYLSGKALAIACPKLDQGLGQYQSKLTAMIEESGLDTITVMMMEVPCCSGLLQIVQQAVANSSRKIPVKQVVISLEGKELTQEWVSM